MPKVLLGEEMRRAERVRRADERIRAQVGAWQMVTGRNLTDLARAIGMSPATLYNRMRSPGELRLCEYVRLMDVIGKEGVTDGPCEI